MDKTTPDHIKKQLRNVILARRRTMSASQVAEYSNAILERIAAFPQYQTANTIMLYMDYQNEAAASLLLPRLRQAGKTPVIPLTTRDFTIRAYKLPANVPDSSALLLSPLGIREPDPEACPPCAPDEIDFIIVPGVAFDRQGNRLGFGKGCYDRFLPTLRRDVLKVAAAYSFQVCSSVPTHPADVPVDFIVTERETIVPVPAL